MIESPPLPPLPLLARAGLVAALLTFIGLGLWQSQTFMVWSEEIIVHPMPAAPVLKPEPGPDGLPQLEPSCAGPDAPLVARSASRPTLNLCSGGRAFPILIAPYFSGFFYWPFALLAPLHHDNAFVLRALGMLLGVISILSTYAVIRRLAGLGSAALTALLTAVLPCFLLCHITLAHFETLPWIWMMGALLFFLGCPGLAPSALPSDRVPEGGISTRRLVAGALFLGLAIAANAKSVVLIAALAALALRLGVPFRRIRRGQWARMILVLAVPLLPMIALSFVPDIGYRDKSTGSWATFIAHLSDPRWVSSSARGLILMWADLAYYFGHLADAPRLHVIAVVVASAALVFVLADTARTLYRGRGCAVTAACGVCLISFALMVTLLYDHFPSNFAPLHTVYAISVAMAATRLTGALGERAKARWPAVLVAATAVLPFAWSSVDTIRSMADVHVHTNADAERALLGYLGERAGEHTPVFTADVMMAGVVDSLSDGTIQTMRAHDFFSICRPQVRNPEAPACLLDRWRRFLPFAVKGSSRYIAPADWSRWGSEHLSYVPALMEAAQSLGYRVTLERTFSTRRGVPALGVYRIEAPAGLNAAPVEQVPAGEGARAGR